ncbi:MAG: hypothetical protein HKO76_02180 [Acidimicrobiia bacterium]|nr:hypothetical protein [Acidimicrobiia bacterium]
MRKAVLFRSVIRLLGEGSEVNDAVYMWKRHRHVLPFGGATFVGMVLLAGWLGWDDWATRIVIGLAATAVAVAASTDYKILADTSSGLYLLDASRIRQTATAMGKQLSSGTDIKQAGGTMLAADWEVDGSLYTVPKSSEQAMNRIAGS